MSDVDLITEYAIHMKALDKMTGGLGKMAYARANTARHAFQELVDRGQGHLIEGYKARVGDPPQKVTA